MIGRRAEPGCAWVQERLVALQDGELGPSELTLCVEHLDRCPTCAALERQLASIGPFDDPQVPAGVQLELERRIDAAVAQALAQPPPRPAADPSTAHVFTRWLRRDRDLSNGAAVTYLFVLALCVGWGLSNWMQLPSPSPTVAQQIQVEDARPDDARAVPSDQYRPASWSTEQAGDSWR